MIEKVQNAWIQIRCEQKSFKRAQVLKNLVVILKLNQKGQILESKTMRSYLNSFTCHGGICSSICNMFHVPVLTHSDASLLISSISYRLNYHFIVFPFLLFSHFVLYYMTDRLTSLWLAESNQIYCYFFQFLPGDPWENKFPYGRQDHKIFSSCYDIFYHDKNFSKSLSCTLEPLSFDIQLMLFWTHNVFCQDHDETLKQQINSKTTKLW